MLGEIILAVLKDFPAANFFPLNDVRHLFVTVLTSADTLAPCYIALQTFVKIDR